MKGIEKSVETNQRQKEFYNSTDKAKKNLPSRIWSKVRNGLLSDFRKQFEIKDKVYEQHKIWLGDLSDKKVLDLGCLRGNALSIYIAQNAKQYIGIDLSDVAIAQLQTRLIEAKCQNAKAVAVDFLSEEFTDNDFDLIYAYGVLHHFEDFDLLIAKLNDKLVPNGQIISYDPLATSLPIKILRNMYRPFQSDKEWEWPFTKEVLSKIDSNFEVRDLKGILGSSKYAVGINLLPLGKTFKRRFTEKRVAKDWNLKKIQDAYSCMHLTMLLQKK